MFYGDIKQPIFAIARKIVFMSVNIRHLTLGLVIGIVLLLGLLLILPIDVVYKVPVTTKVYPAKEWQLIQDQSDYHTRTISRTRTRDNKDQNFVFQRGDVVSLDIHPEVSYSRYVEKDSVILTFRSRMLDLRIQQAMNERAIQFSNLRAGETAMKLPLYQEAQDAVSLAEANLELQELNLGRMTRLFEDGVISKFELDSQTNLYKVAEQELRIAERRLFSTTFENKPEDVEVFATRIGTAEKELEILLSQELLYDLKAPFSGWVQFYPQEGVILSVSDTSMKSLVFPFPLSEKDLVRKGSTLVLEDENGLQEIPFHLDHTTGFINGQQFIMGTGLGEGLTAEIGEIDEAYVRCDTLTIGRYLLRKLATRQ